MKKLLLLYSFLFISLAFSQKQVSNFKFLPTLTAVNFAKSSYLLNWNYQKLFSGKELVIYNSTTNMNDNYYLLGDKYHLSTSKSVPYFGLDLQKIDSFNPSGTANFKSALVIGTINSILKKL